MVENDNSGDFQEGTLKHEEIPECERIKIEIQE